MGFVFARYNPNFAEFLFGSGSFNLAALRRNKTFRNQKFSFASLEFVKYIVIFWVFSINYFCIIFLSKIVQTKKTNIDLFLILIYIFVNLIKSDSVLYVSTLLMYFLLFFSKISTKRKSVNSLE